MVHVRWALKVVQTELNETEYKLLARYAEEHKVTVKEALRLAAKRLVLDDKVYPDDPIFKNIERPSKPAKKTHWSVDHEGNLWQALIFVDTSALCALKATDNRFRDDIAFHNVLAASGMRASIAPLPPPRVAQNQRLTQLLAQI